MSPNADRPNSDATLTQHRPNSDPALIQHRPNTDPTPTQQSHCEECCSRVHALRAYLCIESWDCKPMYLAVYALLFIRVHVC